MTPRYNSFVFKSYNFDAKQKKLILKYGYDDSLEFTEKFTFDFEFVEYNPTTLDRACQLLFYMAGVSYFKAFLAPNIVFESTKPDRKTADFLEKTYQKGLGEFFYVNKLNPLKQIIFPADKEILSPVIQNGCGEIVGLGGGKDSLVSVELMRNHENLATWSVGHKHQLLPLVERVGLQHLWVERQWDAALLDLNTRGAYNGHVPISAILACAGAVTAILSGRRDIVVSNEQSANEPTLEYQGVSINHQYSKSQEFERDFQILLEHHFGDSLRYYSLMRPYTELRICELFANSGYDKYEQVFSSCNRAFTHTSQGMFWCGECPKCAFIFLALTPFVEQYRLEELFGKNLLNSDILEPTYRQLLGISGDKPLECVGEVRECRAAMKIASMTYPNLASKYSFDLPEDYDFRHASSHEIPSEIAILLP